MLILISGQMGSGKTRLAHEVQQKLSVHSLCGIIKFAEPLYECHDLVIDYLNKKISQQIIKPDRDLLQMLGSWGRKKQDDFWVSIFKHRVQTTLAIHPQAILICDDVRFSNELFCFPSAIKIRLKASEECRKKRAQKWGNTEHESETALNHIKDDDFHLVLNTELDPIEHNVEAILGEIYRRRQCQ